MKYKQIAGILTVFLTLPLFGEGQVWDRTEDEPEPIWRVKGAFTLDFYPFSGLNSEQYYNSVWQFNYTAGVELMHTTDQKPISWGGGLVYSIKDFNQNLQTLDSNLARGNYVKNAEHEIRYTELPVIFEYELLNTETTQLFVDGGLVFGLRETSISYKESIAGRKDTLFINDRNFGRFIWGAHAGLGFRQSLSQNLSIEAGLNSRLYFTDLGKKQYVNFSSFGIRLKLVYRLSNTSKAD